MTKAYTQQQVVARLAEYIATHGKRTTAETFGEHVQNLDATLRGDRAPGPKVLKGLGLIRAYLDAPR